MKVRGSLRSMILPTVLHFYTNSLADRRSVGATKEPPHTSTVQVALRVAGANSCATLELKLIMKN